MQRRCFAREKLFIAVMIAVSPALLGDVPSRPESASPSRGQSRANMQGLQKTLSDLLTDAASPGRFNDPKNADRIRAEVAAFAAASHGVDRAATGDQRSYSEAILARYLSDSADEAYRALLQGSREYARTILLAVPSNCITCHTRSKLETSAAASAIEPSGPLRPAELADFYSATRQFDRALALYREVLVGKPGENSDSYELGRAVRNALNITIRVRQDPAATAAVLQDALKNPAQPHFARHELEEWSKSVKAWQKEKSLPARTQPALLHAAKRLLREARTRQDYPLDQTSDIQYLRASALLEEILERFPRGAHLAETLYLQGTAYEVLAPRRLESLHFIYYESCIRASPHTAQARKCYWQYERSTFLGYTGSGGTQIPPDTVNRLLELWSVASETKGKI